jgi:hypothetical protein
VLPATPECETAVAGVCTAVLRTCIAGACEIQCTAEERPTLPPACLRSHPCADDVEALCADRTPGTIMECLHAHRHDVDADCKRAEPCLQADVLAPTCGIATGLPGHEQVGSRRVGYADGLAVWLHFIVDGEGVKASRVSWHLPPSLPPRVQGASPGLRFGHIGFGGWPSLLSTLFGGRRHEAQLRSWSPGHFGGVCECLDACSDHITDAVCRPCDGPAADGGGCVENAHCGVGRTWCRVSAACRAPSVQVMEETGCLGPYLTHPHCEAALTAAIADPAAHGMPHVGEMPIAPATHDQAHALAANATSDAGLIELRKAAVLGRIQLALHRCHVQEKLAAGDGVCPMPTVDEVDAARAVIDDASLTHGRSCAVVQPLASFVRHFLDGVTHQMAEALPLRGMSASVQHPHANLAHPQGMVRFVNGRAPMHRAGQYHADAAPSSPPPPIARTHKWLMTTLAVFTLAALCALGACWLWLRTRALGPCISAAVSLPGQLLAATVGLVGTMWTQASGSRTDANRRSSAGHSAGKPMPAWWARWWRWGSIAREAAEHPLNRRTGRDDGL